MTIPLDPSPAQGRGRCLTVPPSVGVLPLFSTCIFLVIGPDSCVPRNVRFVAIVPIFTGVLLLVLRLPVIQCPTWGKAFHYDTSFSVHGAVSSAYFSVFPIQLAPKNIHFWPRSVVSYFSSTRLCWPPKKMEYHLYFT